MRNSMLQWIIGFISLLALLVHIIDPVPEKRALLLVGFIADQSVYLVTSFACFFLAHAKMKARIKNNPQSILLWMSGSALLIDASIAVAQLACNGDASPPPSHVLHLLIHLIITLVFFFFAYSHETEKNSNREQEPNP